jgi:hypothetical protein
MSSFDQAKDQYAQKALGAFREVSDALVASQKLAILEDQQNREVAALTESVAIANRRYLGGLASYYEVLEAQQLPYPAELGKSLNRSPESAAYSRWLCWRVCSTPKAENHALDRSTAVGRQRNDVYRLRTDSQSRPFRSVSGT